MPINTPYGSPDDLPRIVPVFPLTGVLLLPRGELPLSIFEPRYTAMIDDALGGERVVGVLQPRIGPEGPDEADVPALSEVGCLGRITSFQESGDGRYLVGLSGIARFAVEEEVASPAPYRRCRVTSEPFRGDFEALRGEDEVDRRQLLDTFRAYLEANDLQADWGSIGGASTETLVNALSMMSPFGPREKQALLEAEDLKTRADVLIAVTQISLAREPGDAGPALQ